MNSSGNAILRTLLQKAAPQTRRELEALVNGECVTKKISQELTYRELYDSIDNLWSVLVTTGYLTWREETDRNTYRFAIPNREIWEEETGIVIEIKYPDNGDLEAGCREALEQIERKRYAERLMQDGMKTIHKYGIACYKKTAKCSLGKSGRGDSSPCLFHYFLKFINDFFQLFNRRAWYKDASIFRLLSFAFYLHFPYEGCTL